MYLKQLICQSLSVYKKSQLNVHKVFSRTNCDICRNYVQTISVRCYSSVGETKYFAKENYFVFQHLKSPRIETHASLNWDQLIYTDTDFTTCLNKEWRSSSATEITKAFISVKPFCISHNITISDPRFDCLVDGLIDNCEQLTDNELYHLLKTLTEYPKCHSNDAHNFHDVWSCLDDICCWKMRNWDVDTTLLFGDFWFKLGLSKLADYIFEVIDRFVKKAGHLTKDQLVHIYFYFNVCRKQSVDFAYEYALQQKIHEMNVDEMAVVALGYFKSQTRIKLETILEAMIMAVANSAKGIHEITLSAIMKAVRHAFPHKLKPQIYEMLNRLHPELDRISNLGCLHVALLTTSIQTCHPDVLIKCSKKLVEDIPTIRLKDIERILNVLTMFNFDPNTKPDIFEALFEELHKDSRIGEINKHVLCLPSALHYFSLKAKYSYNLMDRLLDHEFISTTFGKSPRLLPLPLLSLDCCIDIECPDYNGHRLPADVRYKAVKWNTEWAPTHDQHKKITVKQQLFLDTLDSVKSIVGKEECVHVDHILPHFPIADIIVCKDLTTGTFTSTNSLKQYVLGDIMRVSQDSNFKWFAILPFTWNNVAKDSHEPFGFSIMKLRQLRKIGYTPVIVSFSEFVQLTTKGKEEYILRKLV